jgi:hypothetical protein
MDSTVVNPLLNYLSHIENYLWFWYSPQTRHSLMALAVFIRGCLAPDQIPALGQEALNLFDRAGGVQGFTMEALGWIMISLQKAVSGGKVGGKVGDFSKIVEVIWVYLKNKVNETAETANFISGYGDQGVYVMLHSDRR